MIHVTLACSVIAAAEWSGFWGLIIFGINIVKITEQETWTCLKMVFALKRISHQSSLFTVYSNLINRSHSSPTKELLMLWTVVEVYFSTYFSIFPLFNVAKVDLLWILHLADGVPPQCAQTRT